MQERASTRGVKWAVANTHASRELFAIENLKRQNFRSYCPMIAKRVRLGRKWTSVRRPMFPGYVFIAMDNERQDWRRLLSTYGVRRLICHGDRPGLLDGDFVATLMARENEGVVDDAAKQFRAGQSVRLRGGSFDGLAATILELDPKNRVTVLLNLLNGEVRAKVPVDGICSV